MEYVRRATVFLSRCDFLVIGPCGVLYNPFCCVGAPFSCVGNPDCIGCNLVNSLRGNLVLVMFVDS